LSQQSCSVALAAAKAGLDVKGLDLFEIKEAFAAVTPSSADELGIDEGIVNVNSSAIALVHPVGMSRARFTLPTPPELHHRAGGVAAVSLCGGGGQGDAATRSRPST
jgi:acetyl-CoA C-acetyltransferase